MLDLDTDEGIEQFLDVLRKRLEKAKGAESVRVRWGRNIQAVNDENGIVPMEVVTNAERLSIGFTKVLRTL